MLREQGGVGFEYNENNFKKNNYRTIQIKILKSIKRTNFRPSQHSPSEYYNWSLMQAYINSHFEYAPLKLFSYFSLVVVNYKTSDLINPNY